MTSQETAVEGGLDEPTGLEPEQGDLALVRPGDEHTRVDWEKATAAVLRKARRMTDADDDALVWEKLTRTTLDGIAVAPLGTPDLVDGIGATARPTRQGAWDIRAHLGAGEAEQANQDALVDLNGGVTSLWLSVEPGTDFATLLDGVFLDLAPVVLEATSDALATAEAFLSYVGDLELHPGTNLGVPASQATAELAAAALERGVLAFVVDGTRVHDRGASDAQELGWTMSAAADYLRALTGAGVSLQDAARLVEFRLAVTDEQFPSIAKLRAARRLWARVLELSGLSGAPEQRQHAVTSRPMMSRYDPYVNMLRTTVAAFAAGVGGADAVTVLPFDSPLGKPETLGRRVARNTSALLISESHLARVADPAGGSYAVEKLTADLAAAGWSVLGELESGADLDAAIAEVVAVRDAQVASRARPITGLTEFPDLAEELPQRAPDGAFDDVRPYGAAFEEMRDHPPSGRVFLATLGSIASHTARATFATNLLAAGGVAVDVAGATADVAALVAAYDGQDVVCLAGSDPTYAERGEAAAAALREAGASRVLIAGKATAYCDDACAMGVDALAFLTRTREALA